MISVRSISKKLPDAQYYWVLPIPIPNIDIGFMPHVLQELDK